MSNAENKQKIKLNLAKNISKIIAQEVNPKKLSDLSKTQPKIGDNINIYRITRKNPKLVPQKDHKNPNWIFDGEKEGFLTFTSENKKSTVTKIVKPKPKKIFWKLSEKKSKTKGGKGFTK